MGGRGDKVLNWNSSEEHSLSSEPDTLLKGRKSEGVKVDQLKHRNPNPKFDGTRQWLNNRLIRLLYLRWSYINYHADDICCAMVA